MEKSEVMIYSTPTRSIADAQAFCHMNHIKPRLVIVIWEEEV